MGGKLGKLPPDLSRPRLRLSTLIPDAAVVQPPETIDWLSEITTWPMQDNDRYGDCVEAAMCHALEGFTAYGQGTPTVPPDGTATRLYSAITGFKPADPNTDQGTVIQDGLDYWRKTGIDGDKILFFAQVDLTNEAELAAALYTFGHVLIGFTVTQSAMDQFDAGQPWSVSMSPGTDLGGHCVNVGYLDRSRNRAAVVTWGQVQQADLAFLDRYADEAWVIATEDWVNRTSLRAPAGLDVEALNAEFSALTGKPGPFPNAPVPPDPTPPPPAPVPGPTPPVDQADVALAPILGRIIGHPWHHVTHAERGVFGAWLADKGLSG